MLNFFYGAAGIGLLLMGLGAFWAAYQVVFVLVEVRRMVLPQVDDILTRVRSSLEHIDDLTQDVDTTVENANQIVATANRAVQGIEQKFDGFQRNVASPMYIRWTATKRGVAMAWKTYKDRARERAEMPPSQDDRD